MNIRFTLSALLFYIVSYSYSQTFVNESFSSGQMPPPGWTIDQYGSYWTISQSTIAGGVSPEGRFSYSTGTPIITRLISPAVDLTGLVSVKLSFNHFFDWFANPGPSLGVATRSGPDMEWHTVWEITPIGNIGPTRKDVNINNTDVGSSQFQFCFYISGSTSMMDFWYVDDIILLNPLEINAQLASISQTPSTFSAPAEVKGIIRNLGSDTVISAEIAWQLDGGTVHSTSFDGLSLKTFDTYAFTCTDLLNAPIGLHNLKVWLGSVNSEADLDNSDDTLSKVVNKVCYSVPRKPLFEEFTSSTCIPCAFFNSDFVPWCDDHQDDITLIKYQMNFPGIGDPYFIEECGTRFNYYGGSWVPWLEGDGAFVDTQMNDVNALFESDSAQAGLMKIQVAHSFSGQVITVNLNILPFVNFTACKLYIAVIEKTTHDNIGSNGETSFEHVLMRMIPNASGVFVNLQERIPYTYSQTMNLSGTNVEEWDDLMVVAWVQSGSRKIFQSSYSIENASLNVENRLEDILVDGTSLVGFNQDLYSYNYGVPQGVSIPEVTGIPVDSAEMVIVIPALTIPGTTTLDVYGEDIQYHSQYLLNFFQNTGLDENPTRMISVYPNPASDYICISGAGNSRISVTDAIGKKYKVINDFNGNRISLSGLPAGIYFLKAERPGYPAIVQKFIITAR